MWENKSEQEFREDFCNVLSNKTFGHYDFVTGPGRSGAIAAVYASHFLNIPYVPHKAGNYEAFSRVLIVDTVEYTGKTLRKAAKWYAKRGLSTHTLYTYKEYKGHYYKFWYET